MSYCKQAHDHFDVIMGNRINTDSYILTRDFSDEVGNKYWARFSSKPFEEGVSRYAFRGQLRGSGPKKDKNCVVKVFKEEYAEKFEDWVPDLFTSITAKDYTNKFMKEVVPMLNRKKRVFIEFVLPMMAEVDESTMVSNKNIRKNQTIDKKEFVAIEEFLDGTYVKFNSNAGYENQTLSDIMPAFSHWSWERSGKKLMVCDLQGVKKEDRDTEEYLLTDPAIHSVEETFGMTDLGVAGVYRVLGNHKCNDICKQLELENPVFEIVRYILTIPVETTYKFELTEDEKRLNAMEKRP